MLATLYSFRCYNLGMTTDKIITINQSRELIDIFRQNHAVLLAYVFGSVTQDKHREGSDFDLAIFRDRNSELNEFGLIKETTIATLIPNLHLSVVDMESSPLLLKQIIDGVCIYERDKYLKTNTEAMVMNIYFDTQHFRDVQNYYLQKRIEEGTYGYR